VVLGLSLVPYFSQLIRASMLETIESDFVTTARSKGLPYRITVSRHMVRNSLIPMVTNAGPLFGFVITGAFIIEHIMDVPGMGDLFVDSFLAQPVDLNMALAATVLFSFVIIVVDVVVDVAVALLDPRITHD
jgi:ABC-type dipeptide/oligopeptide/nickel transport system permease component